MTVLVVSAQGSTAEYPVYTCFFLRVIGLREQRCRPVRSHLTDAIPPEHDLRTSGKAGQYDCVVVVADHSDYDYQKIVRELKLLANTPNASKRIDSPKIVRC